MYCYNNMQSVKNIDFNSQNSNELNVAHIMIDWLVFNVNLAHIMYFLHILVVYCTNYNM